MIKMEMALSWTANTEVGARRGGDELCGAASQQLEDSVMGWAWYQPGNLHGSDRDNFGACCWLDLVFFVCWCFHGRRTT